MTPSTAIRGLASSDPRELYRRDVLRRRCDGTLWEVRALRKGKVYLRKWNEDATIVESRSAVRRRAWSVSLRFVV